MPPILALILCTIFVLFLLRLEHKQSQNVTIALWLPTVWFLCIASKPLGVWFGVGGDNIEEGSSLDRVFLIILLMSGLLVLLKRKISWSLTIKDYKWLLVILFYMLLSCLWSAMPFISFKRWTRELIAIVMVLIIATESVPQQALKSIFRKTIYILMPFSLILIKYYPHLGVQFTRWSGELMWIGVAQQKNGLGRLCILAVFFLIWSLIVNKEKTDTKNRNYIDVFMLILTLYLMGGPSHSLNYSATSNIVLAIGLITLLTFIMLKKRNIIPGFFLIMVFVTFSFIYGIVTPFIGGLSIIDPSAAMGRSETLTDRSGIWAALIPYAMQQPFCGHGFGGFWTTELRELISSHAHNGYLNLILDLGFVGILLMYTFFITCCFKAIKVMKNDFNWGALWICFLFMTVIYNITEPSIDGFSNQQMATLLFLLTTSLRLP